MLSGIGPVFQQIADRVADDIINGTYAEDSIVPSTNEYAAFYQISPITVGKGINLLVDQGLLYKKRGIGMFVAPGARELLHAERRATFAEQHIAPLLSEASLLGISTAEIEQMISDAATNRKDLP